MNRTHTLAAPLLALGLAACGATNTGNPGTDGPAAPEGIELIRSELTREPDPAVSDAQRETFGSDSRDFALDLYAQAAMGDGNVFLSPYSVQVALAMLYAGAEGDTETEIAGALSFTLPEPTLHAAFNATDRALQGRSGELAGTGAGVPSEEPGVALPEGDLELRVVNAAFAQKGVDFRKPFLDTLTLHYGAGMFAADFMTDPEGERMAINQWVEDQTETRVQDLLPMGSIDPMVVLVLANAIYFKAAWLEPFDPANTAGETFHAPAGDVTVEMMNGFAEQYTEGDGYQALELPYIAPAVRMLFILPEEGRFDEIETGLDRAFVDRVRGDLSRYTVTLKVPKFSFESGFQLVAAMQALGMERAFQGGVADLSGIAGDPGDLYVSDIFHKAFVAVDEQGTEAAAATAVIARDGSAPPPAGFFLDRPFLFLIYDEPTGQILFVGRLMDPS